MAKGTIAKAGVVEIIKQAFGNNYIGEIDKKYYVWSEEDGQKVQVSISLTCPKTPIETNNCAKTGETSSSDPPHTELSSEDSKKVSELMIKLGFLDRT